LAHRATKLAGSFPSHVTWTPSLPSIHPCASTVLCHVLAPLTHAPPIYHRKTIARLTSAAHNARLRPRSRHRVTAALLKSPACVAAVLTAATTMPKHHGLAQASQSRHRLAIGLLIRKEYVLCGACWSTNRICSFGTIC
jgi:hypothetical protein